MDTIKSFKGYGKVDPREEEEFRKKNRKRIIILIVSVIVLLAIIIGIVAGTLINKNKSHSDSPSSSSSPAAALKAICGITEYKDSCYTSISSLETSKTTDPEKFFYASLQVALYSLEKLSTLPNEWISKTKDLKAKKALEICKQVFDDAVDTLNETISLKLESSKVSDLKTMLSAAITDQETCLDALEEINATMIEDVRKIMKNSTEFTSNSLAIVSKVFGILGDFNIPGHRKLLGSGENSGFPGWVGAAERRLLQVEQPTPNVTVAKDGSGNVTTLKEAFALVPKKSKTRFIIYVKAGKYLGNSVLDKAFWNVMIYGDGKTRTIFSGSLNFIDGTPTFSTATFAIAGRGFIAKDIGFENTAGAAKHQAVAMRSGSDMSVFYRCSFNAFQDTLYPHSHRQFYRECDVTGTIDFIFGNAAVIFQNCQIQPRQPLSNQFVTITAQGKKDPNQNTGISIQKCTMSPLDKLVAPTYLGRPWKDYSTTIIMQTEIGSFLNPIGWIEWVKGVEPPKSIFYGEYQNTGPGADVSKRVKWAGYKSMVTSAEASKFTVQPFVQGTDWLPVTNVLFDSTL